MTPKSKTVIVTGASSGHRRRDCGGVSRTCLQRRRELANHYHVRRRLPADNLALVDGDIGDPATAAKIVDTALARFRTIDVVVNNAGIFFSKPFLDYTAADFRSLVSTNLEGFLYVTQLAIKQMLLQKSGGSIICITTTLVDHPIAGINCGPVPMMTKGGLEAATRNLAMEYAKEGIRVNAVAPGTVDTPMHAEAPRDVMKSLSPMGRIVSVRDIAEAVVFLTEAATVTGEVLHVDGGSHVGKW